MKFYSKYIYTEENQHIFKDFIDSEEQVIAISSPYGTGKHILLNNSSQSLTKYYLSLIDKVSLIVYMMNYKNKVFKIIMN